MLKYILFAVLLVSVVYADDKENAQNFAECVGKVEVPTTVACAIDTSDEDCEAYMKLVSKGDDVDLDEFFKLHVKCYNNSAEETDDEECKTYFEAMADCSGQTIAFAFALLALIALIL
ncbi:hypothetical protein PPERSA_00374 [Pseudocohnilembus persalinus]|uniref:Uncharacterized protein n=1 Tax=Pseudocohnilembus persalinus TaxID=266149 RepID=A0A0V0QYI0_PSEPJ|nr:hypothetical protein PPERSA_00373 [Pseudocohnilembus persalinus]KRX07217.1 hypothetical protein PPERSA_00374 [Pseudocohnilembus persalinus]|eukprot:KRX07216.1 hypothetical protein PPERSA_00373 [Pseudocohnilembus persalinus]